jgi:hypothetical protein
LRFETIASAEAAVAKNVLASRRGRSGFELLESLEERRGIQGALRIFLVFEVNVDFAVARKSPHSSFGGLHNILRVIARFSQPQIMKICRLYFGRLDLFAFRPAQGHSGVSQYSVYVLVEPRIVPELERRAQSFRQIGQKLTQSGGVALEIWRQLKQGRA